MLFSFWDQIARTYKMRAGDEPIELGITDFDDESWQSSVLGMLKTPFVRPQQWKGLKCCSENKGCCVAIQNCCIEGAGCCREAKACCGISSKS